MNPTVKDPKQVFIIGCGDIGRRVALQWQQRAVPVHGLARSESSAQAMRAAGITPLRADLDLAESLAGLTLPPHSLLYYFAPPPDTDQADPRMGRFITALRAASSPPSPGSLPQRMVLISTSGVYGDHQGRQVNEDTPPDPQVDRARRRFDAEQQLRNFGRAQQLDVVVLRVGGIYGPDRLPEKRLRQRVPMVYEDEAPQTNRIHADDLAQVCVAAAQRGRADAVYNVSDGNDSNMTEYFNAVADHLGVPRPPLISMQEAERTLSAGMVSYLKESRRMDNRRMLRELGVTLRYPDLATGLKGIEPNSRLD